MVVRRHPVIASLVDELDAAGAIVAMMSGSGSTVFGVFSAVPAADRRPSRDGLTIVETRTSERVVRVELDE